MKTIEARGHVVKVVDFTGTRFDGDGRRRIDAIPGRLIEGTQPLRLRRSQCRQVIQAFEERGETVHSPQGGTVWVLVEWYLWHGIPFKVDGSPQNGWVVRRVR